MRGSSRAPLVVGALPGQDLIDGQCILRDLDDDLCKFIRRTAPTKFDFPKRAMSELPAVALDQLLKPLRRNSVVLAPPADGVNRCRGTLHARSSTTVCCLCQRLQTSVRATVGCA